MLQANHAVVGWGCATTKKKKKNGNNTVYSMIFIFGAPCSPVAAAMFMALKYLADMSVYLSTTKKYRYNYMIFEKNTKWLPSFISYQK